jgi:hypothetical protein
VAKRRKKRRSRSLIVWAVVLFVAAGFLARRILAPRALYYLTHRPPRSESPMSPVEPMPPIESPETRPALAPADSPPHEAARANPPPRREPLAIMSPAAVSSPAARAQTPATAGGEDLSASDRHELDELLKRNAR